VKATAGCSENPHKGYVVVSVYESFNFLRVGPSKTHIKLALDTECLYFFLKLDALALFYETNG